MDAPPLKSTPWQSWHDAKPPPEASCAIFARAPWLAGKAQPGIGRWWQSAVMQLGMPLPVRVTVISWHSLQPLRAPGDSAFPGWMAIQSTGWKCPFWLGPAPRVWSPRLHKSVTADKRRTATRFRERAIVWAVFIAGSMCEWLDSHEWLENLSGIWE